MNHRLKLLLFAVATLLPLAAQADDDGFVPLFDGKTLDGWDGDPRFWSVRDGAITGQTTLENPTEANTFIIWTKGTVGDFELKLQYKIVDGNSGIQYRSFKLPDLKWGVGGYQGDLEAGDRYSGILYGEKFRGILADRGKKTVVGEGGEVRVVGSVGESDEIQTKIRKEDWNEYHIIAKGNHFVHKINGVVTCECTDEDSAARAKGIVALQLHRGPPMTVQFRNIMLKRTDSDVSQRKVRNQKQQRAVSAKQRAASAKKKIVFVSGKPSHKYGAHEHYAGCLLLAKSLQAALPEYETVVHRHGWPEAEQAFEGADAIVMYCDGGEKHFVNDRLAAVDQLADSGVGIVCLHYAVEVPKGESGDRFLDWIGGYFEIDWSVNPHWTAKFNRFPDHPITRGVEPFEINDEWYYHMRFRAGMEGVTPILTDLPPDSSLSRPDGPHSGNPDVRAAIAGGEPQHVAWASERAGGGRGFGFTGGHNHWNWGDPNFRKVVLNAIVWAAHGEVPAEGVQDPAVTLTGLEVNQDYPQPADFDLDAVKKRLQLPDDKHAAGEALTQLDVHPQLKATLLSAEPQMANPTNIDIDHLGRIWVCEVLNYRRFRNKQFPERQEGDRILVMEDTDGDGQVDKSTTFYQGRDIDSAHGICVLPDPNSNRIRALVSAKDQVFFLTDEDGDLQADGKEVLFMGIGGTEHDHGIHAFVFGPDGKLYFNFGNEGKQIRHRSGRPVVDLAGNVVNNSRQPYQEGMVFRCNLDGSEFETLGWNFRNNWEVAVDSYGTLWQSDNDDDGNRGTRINFVMEFGNYGYKDEKTGANWKAERTNMHTDVPLRHWHLNDPGVVPNLLQTGAGSPTGICIYEGRLLPVEFQGQMLHTDAGPNIVRSYPVYAQGAGYSAQVINILDGAQKNQWFRPSDVCVAPDGSIVVADWYDPGVGGHRMEDVDRGRLFRVTNSEDGPAFQTPEFDFSTVAGSIKALANPNLAVRSMAWRALHTAGTDAEAPLLEVLEQADDPRLRARALWILGKLPERGQHYVDLALENENADLRIVGIRLARQLKLDLIPVVQKLVRDEARVRRELAIALRGHKSPEAPKLWAELANQHDGEDRWYLEALGISATGQWDQYLGAWLELVGDGWNTAGGRDIIWRSRSRLTAGYLAKIVKDENTPLDTHPRYFRAFDFLSGPEKDKALESILEL